MPQLKRSPACERRTISDNDINSLIDNFSLLSLGPLASQSRRRHSSKVAPKSRSNGRAISTLKPIFQPSPPLSVSPKLDTSVAVSHKSLKNSPSQPSFVSIPRTQNIDIPRPHRRKICSIPYLRPTVQPISPPEPPSSSFLRSVRRTPSLVSDHGSEASSPSTPPDPLPISIPTSTLTHEGACSGEVSLLDQLLVPLPGWQGIDFGTDIYG